MNNARPMTKDEFNNLKKGDKVYISKSHYIGKVDGTVGKFIQYRDDRKTLAVIENPQWKPNRLSFWCGDLGVLEVIKSG